MEIAFKSVTKLILYLIQVFFFKIKIMKLFIMNLISNRVLKLEEIKRIIFYSNNGKSLKYNLMNDIFILANDIFLIWFVNTIDCSMRRISSYQIN